MDSAEDAGVDADGLKLRESPATTDMRTAVMMCLLDCLEQLLNSSTPRHACMHDCIDAG